MKRRELDRYIQRMHALDGYIQRIRENDPTLTELGLRGWYLNDESFKALTEALKGNTTLKKLKLDNTNVRDEEVQALAEALKENKTLEWLDLWENIIEDKGAQALAEALKENETLRVLYFPSGFHGPEEGLKALAEAVKENTTLEHLVFDDYDSDRKIKKEINGCCAFNMLLNQVRRGKRQVIDAQNKDLSKAQLKALIQLQKTNPNFKVLLSKEDEAENWELVLEEQKKEIERLKEENTRLHEENHNKENAGENQPKNFNAKKKSLGNGKGLDDKLQAMQQAEAKKSLGNGKGLDDKLQARQQAKERLAKVARSKGKGQND